MIYKIEFTKVAAKELECLPKEDVNKIARKIEKLASDPFPLGHEKLKGSEDIYRIRQGDYRILYSIFEKKLIILILKLGHRKDIYR